MLTRSILVPILAVIVVAQVFATAPVQADPPSWAPAHGYRAKHPAHGHHAKHAAHPRPVPVIKDGSCNRDILGILLGGTVGGVAGSNFGKGSGKLAATAGGAVIGALVGREINRSMDRLDRHCVGHVLERVPDGDSIRWANPDTGARYHMVPLETVTAGDNRYCREYLTEAVVNGKTRKLYGKACREPDGSWRLMN